MITAADKIIDDWKLDHHYRDLIQKLRNSKRPIVFTNGCFDVLHVGHMMLLNRAKRLRFLRDPWVVVGLNHDASVTAAKGKGRQIFPFYVRAYQLASLEAVDYVVGFTEPQPSALIGLMEPDVLVKGGEYEGNSVPGDESVRKKGGVVVFIPTLEGVSTTHIISRRVDLPEFDYKEV